mmetsp:Transcript_21190/g.53399  ORF Transcript_21190/g.53399 Transcript_21190/m.53399 type:complete len:107 (-) Transcript_21190:2160-2480(-)
MTLYRCVDSEFCETICHKIVVARSLGLGYSHSLLPPRIFGTRRAKQEEPLCQLPAQPGVGAAHLDLGYCSSARSFASFSLRSSSNRYFSLSAPRSAASISAARAAS